MTVLWEKETVNNLSHFTNKKLNIYQTFTRNVTTLQFLVYRLLFKHFCLLSFFPKDSVSLLLASFSFSVGWPLGRHRRKYFWDLGLQIAVFVSCSYFWKNSDYVLMKLSSQKKSARKIYNYLISSNKRPGCLFQIDLRSGVGGGGRRGGGYIKVEEGILFQNWWKRQW